MTERCMACDRPNDYCICVVIDGQGEVEASPDEREQALADARAALERAGAKRRQ
jgi:hypothetical protein